MHCLFIRHANIASEEGFLNIQVNGHYNTNISPQAMDASAESFGESFEDAVLDYSDLMIIADISYDKDLNQSFYKQLKGLIETKINSGEEKALVSILSQLFSQLQSVSQHSRKQVIMFLKREIDWSLFPNGLAYIDNQLL